MKKSFFYIFLFVFSGMFQLTGAPVEEPVKIVKTKINSVQLYGNQALVRRHGRIELKKGINHLAIVNLPAQLLNQSVQLALKNSSGIQIQEVRVETKHQKIYQSQEAKSAEKRLRRAESQLRSLSDRYHVLKKEEKYLKNIKIGHISNKKRMSARRIDAGRWSNTLNFIQKSLRNNHIRLQILLEKIDLAREELSVAMTLAKRYRSVISLSKKSAYFTLVARRATGAVLRMDYRIHGAGWFPIYTARVTNSSRNSRRTGKARVQMLAYALVKNKTGEDWKNVRLVFSAANPNEAATLPPLYSWKIRSQLRDTRTKYAADKSRASGSVGYGRKGRRKRYRRYNRAPRRKAKRHYKEMRPAPEAKKRPVFQSKREYAMNQVQQRVIAQSKIAGRFYNANKSQIQERRARRRSDAVELNLNLFSQNKLAQERAWKNNRYQNVLRRSSEVLANIRQMDPKYRNLFDKEGKRARFLRKMALKFIDQEKIVRHLILPNISSRGYDYRYSASIRETIRSDGAFHKVLIMNKKFSANLVYESAPARKKLAFLQGRIKYKDAIPLLAGPVSVFHNADFVGDSLLRNVSEKETFKLNLGNDEAIQIERRTGEYREKSGIFSKSYIYKKTITTKIKNRKKYAITIFVYERVPVPRDDRVKITNIRTNIKPESVKKDYGLYRFRLRLAPGEKKEIIIKYRLSHPENVLPIFQEQGSPRW